MRHTRFLNRHDLIGLDAKTQHGYMLYWRNVVMNTDKGNQCPGWFFFLLVAYFDGDTEEIDGTYDMSLYEDILLNQITHDNIHNSKSDYESPFDN